MEALLKILTQPSVYGLDLPGDSWYANRPTYCTFTYFNDVSSFGEVLVANPGLVGSFAS